MPKEYKVPKLETTPITTVTTTNTYITPEIKTEKQSWIKKFFDWLF